MLPVSVILPSYNQEGRIAAALESIIAQTIFLDCEVIVSDDASNDSTTKVVEQYASKHSNISLLTNKKNLGVMGNYRNLVDKCNGRYIAPLEGDDLWLSTDRLETMVAYMDDHPDINGCFGDFYVFDQSDGKLRLAPTGWTGKYKIFQAQDLILANHSASFSNCFYRANRFRTVITSLQNSPSYDWATNIIVAANGGFAHIPGAKSVYTLHSTGTWTRLSKAQQHMQIVSTLQNLANHLPENLKSFALERACYLKEQSQTPTQINDCKAVTP
ncbi:MAG: glycosyltransferase [Candidatus Melainabacteria bacterium]|nr:glycosyltransferase [Candidatus Melainabacteria bacterium]